jgi:Transcription factor WhiB
MKPDFSTRDFYPEAGQPVAAEAKQACRECPVLEQCAEWAIHHEAHGYMGGMSPRQRFRIRSERNIILWEPQSNVVYPVVNSRPYTRKPQKDIPHGTPAMYKRERKLGQAPCDACRKAHTEQGREAKRLMRERQRQQSQAS